MNFQFSIFNFQKKQGQAALIAVILMLVIMLSAVFGASAVALKEAKVAESDRKSRLVFFGEEAAIEDAVYRSKRGKLLGSQVTMTLNDSNVIATITTVGAAREIISTGDVLSHKRASKVVLNSSSGISFPYGVQVGNGGLEMNNNSEVRGSGGAAGNVYSNGPATGSNSAKITGNLTIANANSVNGLIVYGTVRANTVTNTKICGDAYYQIIDSNSINFLNSPSSPTCSAPLTPGTANPGSANSPSAPLPISDAQIQSWKNDAEAGGTTSGDVTVASTQTIGPRKITGKLTVTNGATLIVSGTLWVVGDIVFDNNSIIRLASSYGSFSGVVISDAKIGVKNNVAFSGSGDPASFMMVVAAKNSTGEEIINADNNSRGVIYYAGNGWIKFSNNAAAKEATAYGIRLDNNAVITYDSGLANAQFSSGPSGGWDIISWEEIIP